uniref:Coenzyme Q-binding protein COQ10 START domain-containing protein n=1 Tax=Erythrolobus australicus TaxID=1077150 RepID=A0A7S1XIM4_9RHOD|mmetsp:Transcript_936/g.2588  ORF Transcript_936/g.2588 Transcript_936/m.2588 type:complete len:296 (+) Transcript_936:203-1090(+)
MCERYEYILRRAKVGSQDSARWLDKRRKLGNWSCCEVRSVMSDVGRVARSKADAPLAADSLKSKPERINGHDVRVCARMLNERTCKVDLSGSVDIQADHVFRLLTHPENHVVFRNQRPARLRNVLWNDGHRQTIEIVQEAVWRFLMFSGSFAVHIIVDQDSILRRIKYRTVKPGFMRRFEGIWCVQGNPRRRERADTSVVHLSNLFELAIAPPRPMRGLVLSIASHVTSNVYNDFRNETLRIKRGSPSYDWIGECELEAHEGQDSSKQRARSRSSSSRKHAQNGYQYWNYCVSPP